MNTNIETIRNEFRRSPEARYIHRLHAVLFMLQGMTTVEAARLLGDSQRAASKWMIRFREQGLDGLRDADKSGRPATLKTVQNKALHAAFSKPPSASGLEGKAWTGALASEFLRKRYGIRITIRHCRRRLRDFELERESKSFSKI